MRRTLAGVTIGSRLGLLAAGAAAFLAATTPAAAAMKCRPNYDFAVEVDGSYPPDACFYQADAPRKFFIDIPSIKDGLLMDLNSKRIVAVPRSRISQAGSDLVVQDGAPPDARSYAFSIEGPIIEFQAERRKVRVLPVLIRPPLVGQVELERLIADRAEYREGMKAYGPDAGSIDAIRKYAKGADIEAYFATWCSHCKEFMPKFLRVVQEAKNPRINLKLVGVPKRFAETAGPWQGKNITSIPTIIVKIDGKEITRLGAHPGAVPERELAGIFQAIR
jgi:thiol-disulfide isomerase/thioredoxin